MELASRGDLAARERSAQRGTPRRSRAALLAPRVTRGARAPQVADLVGADPKEIIFTSGATESNNMSIKGVANFYKDKKRHIITTQTERARPRAGLAASASATWLRAGCLHRALVLRPR